MKSKFTIKILLMMLICSVTISTLNVEASNRGKREKEMSRNGAVHQERYDEILANLDKYAYVDDFTLTRYIPRDATEQSWSATTNGIGSTYLKSVYWEKVSGGWVFSSASAERFEIAKDKFSGKGFTEKTLNYKNDSKKIIYQMNFKEDITKAERDSIMPYQCKASIQYAGDPFSGAFGFVDWGSVAADVKHNKLMNKDAKLFIEGYGKGDVHDVGGGIRGRHLDLFMDNCEEGFKGGKSKNRIVVFEKAKSSISGKPVTKEILDKIMAGHKWGDDGDPVELGADADGSGAGGKGDGNLEGGPRENFNPFRTHKISPTVVGIDDSERVMPSESSYLFNVLAMNIFKILQWFMVILCIGLIIFVSLQIAGLVLMSKGNYGMMNDRTGNFLYGGRDHDVDGDPYKRLVIKNIFLTMIILTLSLGSYFVGIQAKIYYAISQIVGYLF